MPAGRPKITPAQFPKDWREHIIHEMSEGASKNEIYAYLDIDDETFARLTQEDQDFSATVRRGIILCKMWWEKHGRTQLENKDFNSTLWYMNMRNRFGWRDKTETDITSGGKPLPLLGGATRESSSNDSDQKVTETNQTD